MKRAIIIILMVAAACPAGCAGPDPASGKRVSSGVFAVEDCCTSHLECQDGQWCNGVEYCNCWGVCLAGDPVDCNDGNPATVDTCVNDYIGKPGVRGTGGIDGEDGEIGTGHCDHDLVGRPCTTDADCEDDNACTIDECVSDLCRYTSIDCDDGDVCTADSCDPVMGCVHNALQYCCTNDADCDDDNECTIDVCDLDTHLCGYTADTGAICDYPNDCFDPGTCEADGLCYPGTLRVPANDTCAGAIDVVLSDIGEACVTGTTMCALNDYQGSCESGMNADVVYRFRYPGELGAEITQVGTDHTARQRDNCHITDGTAVGCCVTNWWEFTFNFPAAGSYRAGIETENYNFDLSAQGIRHRVMVYLDGVPKGEIVNLATTPEHRRGTIYLGNVAAGNHVIRYHWINDWYSAPFDSNIKIHQAWIQEDNAPYQLYSYNAMVDAEFDSALYARFTCEDTAGEIACNNNCVGTSMLDCGFYGLAVSDSAMTLLPYPVDSPPELFFIVDGKLGERGDFELRISRILHKNNPCAVVADSIRRIDATAGGEFRGNINGYINDMLDAGFNWLKTPCHGAAGAGSDWPATAWFVMKPEADTVYRVWTDEETPATWFDTVITVWDNTSALGCGGPKTYIGCAHLPGRNGPDNPTQLQGTLRGGNVYLVGISIYSRPTAGNYIVHFDIL